MFRLEIETDNAAFEDNYREEVARILEDTARKLRDGREGGYCYDINGNRIGEFDTINKRRA